MDYLPILEKFPADDCLVAYAKLVLKFARLEFLLKEALIHLCIKTTFNHADVRHKIIEDFIGHLSFDRKVQLIGKHRLLSKQLQIDLDTLNKRRNVFIHGLPFNVDGGLTMATLQQENSNEKITVENLVDAHTFLDSIEEALSSEFEASGFKIEP